MSNCTDAHVGKIACLASRYLSRLCEHPLWAAMHFHTAPTTTRSPTPPKQDGLELSVEGGHSISTGFHVGS
eukprot:4880321-Amphidinium_carterae.1